jgi:hypothetical protein
VTCWVVRPSYTSGSEVDEYRAMMERLLRGKNWRNLEKKLASQPLCPAWSHPGLNPGLRGEKTTSNQQHGQHHRTAHQRTQTSVMFLTLYRPSPQQHTDYHQPLSGLYPRPKRQETRHLLNVRSLCLHNSKLKLELAHILLGVRDLIQYAND